eukprot:comp23167_c0_seq1/m.37504 comp23167_c0_seq1/g.37504  ORF comp23167_c0_seq1/g.37504 comp23167_c0_seq1/m.37504 type:complete len:648 (-) comp23167_c0_seq1:600-2543(-)
MAAQPAETAAAFTELDRHLKNDKFDAASRIAAKLVQDNPEDQDAYNAQLYCLINLNQFDAAVKLIDSHKFAASSTYQKAYALYRLLKLDEALDLLRKQPSTEPRFKELEAQILYRKEDYAAALNIYTNILKASQVEDNGEHLTNYLAALAGAKLAGDSKLASPIETLSTYEQHYNAACYAIANGDYVKAEAALQKAKEVCKSSLEGDGFDEQEVEEELGVIRVQLALVAQLTGRTDEARAEYEAVLKNRGDGAVMAVAANNNCVLQGDANVSGGKKILKPLREASLAQKLTSFQNRIIGLNQALLSFHSHQYEQCRQELKTLPRWEEWDMPVLVEAACLAQEKQLQQAVARLKGFLEKNPKAEAGRVHLALAQLAINQGDVEGASKSLEVAAATNPSPGLVSALAALHERRGDTAAAMMVFADAIVFQEKANNKDALVDVLRSQAQFLERIGDVEAAANVYARLIKLNPGNYSELARLVVLYSKFDPEKAELYAEQLPSIDSQVASIDATALEAENTRFKRLPSKKSDTVAAPADEAAKKKRKKRKRKGKLPKDPNSPLDPERWLPKWQRASHRKKNKNKNPLRGPQGAAATTAPSTTGSVGKRTSSSAAAATPVSPGPSQQDTQPEEAAKKKPPQAKPKKGKKKGW